ncbi:hypothetical protein [Rhodococcus jostii]|uniref:Uncharacterized protein n=1 Tax=Rhodococcus jostii TaxID=132919 RepID=A0A1H5C5J9_RHOJO|nr:hypothetical protein [Rhodococcus jostii]SED61751.1 hypothetical protein SAMN04490220_5001 [Rhodococcus jostii]
MRRPRWPAVAPPTTGGHRVHGPLLLTTEEHLTLELFEVVAFPDGLHLRMALTATGRPAELAQYETRSLSDPDDPSTRWSYLSVRARVDDIEGEADPYHPTSASKACRSGPPEYRTEPHYWLDAIPASGFIAVTAGWPRIGLGSTTTTIGLESSTRTS